MHDFLYSICGTKCERFSSVQFYPESCYISCKTKAAGLPPIPLDVYFLPTQTARLPQGVFSTRICASNRSASADNSNLANLSGKLLHSRKAKRYSFHPYRLMFIFSQRRRHDYHMAFSLLESVHRIISPASSLSGKLLHPMQNKSGRDSTIPLNVYFFKCRRHGCRRAFSLPESVHRIAPPMQIDSHHTSLFWKLLHLMQNKSGRASTHTA